MLIILKCVRIENKTCLVKNLSLLKFQHEGWSKPVICYSDHNVSFKIFITCALNPLLVELHNWEKP